MVIADDIGQTRENIRLLLELDRGISIVGQAATGEEVLETVKAERPDVVLMDINMPVMDGIKATELLSLHYPEVAVIMISVQGEQEYLKKAMMAGAREYLIKPFSADELTSTVRRVADLHWKRQQMQQKVGKARAGGHQPRLITIFGARGGMGKTTIAVNLAVALARRTREKVALVDLDLQFGDIGVLMNIDPRRTIAELMQESNEPGIDLLEPYLYERNGVWMLSAPSKPELAELVNEEGVTGVLKSLLKYFDYVIVDTPPLFNDVTLVALDLADLVLMVTTPDLPALKNNKRALDVLKNLSLHTKVRLIINRASTGFGIEEEDVERAMELESCVSLPADVRLVVSSMNRGLPLILVEPNSVMARGIVELLPLVQGQEKAAKKGRATGGLKKNLIGRPILER